MTGSEPHDGPKIDTYGASESRGDQCDLIQCNAIFTVVRKAARFNRRTDIPSAWITPRHDDHVNAMKRRGARSEKRGRR